MSKTGKILAVVVSAACLLIGFEAFAQTSSQFPEGRVGQNYPTEKWNAFEASWLLGHEVSTPEGGRLGTINSLIIDSSNGRVALIVLSDVPRIGSKQLALPYRSVDRTGNDTFVFNPGTMKIEHASSAEHRGDISDPYIYTLTTAAGSTQFYGIPTPITPDWVAAMYRRYGQEPYWAGATQTGAPIFIESTKLLGRDIQSSGGEKVRVSDLIIDGSEGRVAFVILSSIPGRSESLVAVPFQAIKPTGENLFVLQIPAAQLASAPRFDPNAAKTDRGYAIGVYKYFGIQPYWESVPPMGNRP